MSPEASFEKIIYTIGDAARIADVKPYVLRYWETEFEQLRPEKSVTGQRCYRAKDMRVVLTLKRLLHREGFTIVGARKRLAEMGEGDWDAFPSVQEAAEAKGLPQGRSLEGTPDEALREEPKETAPVVVVETLDKPNESAPAIAFEEEPAKAVDDTWRREFDRLWEASERILNKYPL